MTHGRITGSTIKQRSFALAATPRADTATGSDVTTSTVTTPTVTFERVATYSPAAEGA
jgi:hypothetical protein